MSCASLSAVPGRLPVAVPGRLPLAVPGRLLPPRQAKPWLSAELDGAGDERPPREEVDPRGVPSPEILRLGEDPREESGDLQGGPGPSGGLGAEAACVVAAPASPVGEVRLPVGGLGGR